MTTITPALLSALTAIVGALPPTVDHWIAKRVTDAAKLALATTLFGVVDGAVGAALTTLSKGDTFATALNVALVGAISGATTALVNYWKANLSGSSS
jgi:VIT1/CCC1 family predicted Fe2+/Mn2+ transporter